MKHIFLIVFLCCVFLNSVFSQIDTLNEIRFQGLIMDANNLTPISNSHILINKKFSAISASNGHFAFYVNTHDTVVFQSLGYKPTTVVISDTLVSHEYIAGIYLRSDTLSIAEVIILPRANYLKYQILNEKSKVPATMDNAKYNIALGGYQGRKSQGKLGDPVSNYSLLRQKQKIDAFEKGGIPSDRIAGINPLLLIPGAYLLMHGLPEQSSSYKPDLTDTEMEQLNKKFLESLKKK